MENEKINFLEKLRSAHAEHLNVIREAASVASQLDGLMGELTFYESFIPSFFSKYNGGEGNGIRKIYEEMHTRNMNNFVFEMVDLNISLSMYQEYLEGMEEYIKKVADYNDGVITESGKELLGQLDQSKERDHSFVDSLFGGENNKKGTEPYTEAVKNIEFMIDFIPTIGRFKERCESIRESFDVRNVDDEINRSVLELFSESVSNFCFHNMEEIVSSYYTILECATGGTKKEKKTKFRLF